MNILKTSKTPDGTDIQIEDWSDNYSFHDYGDTIAAYPISKWNDDYSPFSPKAGKKFRAEFTFSSSQMAKDVFEELESGTIEIEDLTEFMADYRHRKCLTGNSKD